MLITQSCPTLCNPIRFLCPWNLPGKNTGVGCHSLLQGIFPTQGSNPGLLHCSWILYHLSHQGSILIWNILLITQDIRIFKFLTLIISLSILEGGDDTERRSCMKQEFPNLFSTRDQFHGRQLFMDQRVGGWFWNDSNALHLLCTLCLI